jgi:hypothetical protein
VKDLFDQVNSGEEEFLIALVDTVAVEDAAKKMKIVEREEEVESEERELCDVLPAAAEVEQLATHTEQPSSANNRSRNKRRRRSSQVVQSFR